MSDSAYDLDLIRTDALEPALGVPAVDAAEAPVPTDSHPSSYFHVRWLGESD